MQKSRLSKHLFKNRTLEGFSLAKTQLHVSQGPKTAALLVTPHTDKQAPLAYKEAGTGSGWNNLIRRGGGCFCGFWCLSFLVIFSDQKLCRKASDLKEQEMTINLTQCARDCQEHWALRTEVSLFLHCGGQNYLTPTATKEIRTSQVISNLKNSLHVFFEKRKL